MNTEIEEIEEDEEYTMDEFGNCFNENGDFIGIHHTFGGDI
ncbi:MAG: hypothetical protein ACRCXB_31875 [Aeromonadaceae bacterium]